VPFQPIQHIVLVVDLGETAQHVITDYRVVSEAVQLFVDCRRDRSSEGLFENVDLCSPGEVYLEVYLVAYA